MKRSTFTIYEITVIPILLWSLITWITHVVVCIKASAWGFLIAGALFAPIAVVHGTGVIFNVW